MGLYNQQETLMSHLTVITLCIALLAAFALSSEVATAEGASTNCRNIHFSSYDKARRIEAINIGCREARQLIRTTHSHNRVEGWYCSFWSFMTKKNTVRTRAYCLSGEQELRWRRN